ncbi:MAG: hypothetical protein QW275_02965 [Candidatus Anstonellaceae archaeon]
MAKVSAFCPAYITGIFTIGEGDAAGAGFCIDKGMATSVFEAKEGKTKIFINSKISTAKVSRAVIRRFARHGAKAPLLVRHTTPIPIGYGLGMSAAGAVSLSLALNELFGCGFSKEKCVKIAHDAEVECGTGLSGADAAAIGGVLALRRIGEKPIRIPVGKMKVFIAFYSPINTASVVRQPDWKARVNYAGELALDSLFKQRNWEGLIASSRIFAEKSGLARWCKKEMQGNPKASMAMLGKTLFSQEKINLARKPRLVLRASVSEEGASLL